MDGTAREFKKISSENEPTQSHSNSPQTTPEVQSDGNVFGSAEKNEDLLPRTYRVAVGSKGRGLFAIRDIAAGTLVHVAPCIRIEKDDYEQHVRHTILENYLFNDTGGNKLLALGDGSLFNHSRHPNIDYRVDSAGLCIRYWVGYQSVAKGEELCISYGDHLWFDDADGDGESNTSSSNDGFQEGGIAKFLSHMEI